jgi:hypothetical protein
MFGLRFKQKFLNDILMHKYFAECADIRPNEGGMLHGHIGV